MSFVNQNGVTMANTTQNTCCTLQNQEILFPKSAFLCIWLLLPLLPPSFPLFFPSPSPPCHPSFYFTILCGLSAPWPSPGEKILIVWLSWSGRTRTGWHGNIEYVVFLALLACHGQKFKPDLTCPRHGSFSLMGEGGYWSEQLCLRRLCVESNVVSYLTPSLMFLLLNQLFPVNREV